MRFPIRLAFIDPSNKFRCNKRCSSCRKDITCRNWRCPDTCSINKAASPSPAASDNPKNAQAQLLLAKALLVNDPQDARAEGLLRKSIALDSSSWEAHYELGVLLAAKRNYRNAAAELARASELAPQQAMPHYHLARVYDRLGDTERAKAEREKHQELVSPR